jgi:hypothetical protein
LFPRRAIHQWHLKACVIVHGSKISYLPAKVVFLLKLDKVVQFLRFLLVADESVTLRIMRLFKVVTTKQWNAPSLGL